MPNDPPPLLPRRNLYGRRHGRKLSDDRQAVVDDNLASLTIAGAQPLGFPGRAPVDPRALFPEASEIRLEVGFGGGEHLAALAARLPEVGFIGAEHFFEGVAKLVASVVEQGLQNVRIVPGDARDLLDPAPAAVFSEVYVLYPDPWPKRRHLKRRFINPDNLDALARTMKPGGRLRVASDIPDYIDWTRKQLAIRDDFEGPHGDPDSPWTGWPGTRYEQKAVREGRRSWYLTFRKP